MPRDPKHSRWFKRYSPWLKQWMEKKGIVVGFDGWIPKRQARERIRRAVENCEWKKATAHQLAFEYINRKD